MSTRVKASRDNLADGKSKSSRKDSHMSLNAASSATAAASGSASTITLTIKLGASRNLKGTKGDKVSTFVKVQFADFEAKDVRSCSI